MLEISCCLYLFHLILNVIQNWPNFAKYLRAVCLPADAATLRLRCGGLGRHTCGACGVAWRGVQGRDPNSPLKCDCPILQLGHPLLLNSFGDG
jgi:hypothetical protein